MSSAEDVQNTNGILALPRFQKCLGRVPSDEKIPDDMSDEGKCTVCRIHVYIIQAPEYIPEENREKRQTEKTSR